MDGVGTTWMEHTVDNAFMLAVGVYGADMDQDGDIDILGAAYDDDDMTWWKNTVGDEMTVTNSPTSTIIKATATATATVSKEKKLYLPIIVR